MGTVEKAGAWMPVYSEDPAVLESAPGALADGLDHLADEKFGPGRWRRVSFETSRATPWGGQTDREMVARYVAHGDPELEESALASLPEGAHMWTARAGYEEVERAGE